VVKFFSIVNLQHRIRRVAVEPTAKTNIQMLAAVKPLIKS